MATTRTDELLKTLGRRMREQDQTPSEPLPDLIEVGLARLRWVERTPASDVASAELASADDGPDGSENARLAHRALNDGS